MAPNCFSGSALTPIVVPPSGRSPYRTESHAPSSSRLEPAGTPAEAVRLVPDSRHVILTRSDGPTPGAHLWIGNPVEPSWWARWFRLTAPAVTPLTTTPGNEGWPSVSPDGRTIAVTSEAMDFDLFEVALDGSGLRPFNAEHPQRLRPGGVAHQHAVRVRDGPVGQPADLAAKPRGLSAAAPRHRSGLSRASVEAIGALAFSPDGTKLAFQRASTTAEDRGVGSRIWIVQLPGGKPYPSGRRRRSRTLRRGRRKATGLPILKAPRS